MTISDSFNRADSALSLGNTDTGETWVQHRGGTLGILSNEAYRAADFNSHCMATVDGGFSDGAASLEFTAVVSEPLSPSLVFRFSDSDNFLALGRTALWKVEGGSHGELAFYTPTTDALVDGDVGGVRFNGSNVVMRKNGVDIKTVPNVTFNQTATGVGVYFAAVGFSFDARADDFYAAAADNMHVGYVAMG